MKDFYDFSKMKQIPHPLLFDRDGKPKLDKGGKPRQLKSNILDISDEEFQLKLAALEPSEREFAIAYRQREKSKN